MILTPTTHKTERTKDRDPYKSGYRGIALCLKLVFIWVTRGLTSTDRIAIAFA